MADADGRLVEHSARRAKLSCQGEKRKPRGLFYRSFKLNEYLFNGAAVTFMTNKSPVDHRERERAGRGSAR